MSKFNAHLTENHQLKAADELIAKLRQELGMEKAYCDELENDIKNYKKRILDLENLLKDQKLINKKLNDKYSSDVNHTVKLDPIYDKLKRKIEKLENDLKIIKDSRDTMLKELIKLRGCEN